MTKKTKVTNKANIKQYDLADASTTSGHFGWFKNILQETQLGNSTELYNIILLFPKVRPAALWPKTSWEMLLTQSFFSTLRVKPFSLNQQTSHKYPAKAVMNILRVLKWRQNNLKVLMVILIVWTYRPESCRWHWQHIQEEQVCGTHRLLCRGLATEQS